MDIFNTVASAIDLTERVWKAIDDFQKVPERMRRLQFDVKNLTELMHKLKSLQYRSQEQEALIECEIQEIEKTLKVLQNRINRAKQKPSSSVLSRGFGRFKTQLKFDDMDELADELQRRKASLNLTINMLVLHTVGKVDRDINEKQESTVKAAATTDAPGADQDQTTKKGSVHIPRKEFLEHLNAPNYAEDEIRVKVPAEGTAKWIYDREEYKIWRDDESSTSLHLVGKMGSGKSVLTKSIVRSLKQTQLENGQTDAAVLYYFCSCVNRTDNPASILAAFISQLVLEHENIYETVAKSTEVLQSRRTGDSTSWPFEALWHIFSRMVQLSGLKSLYCVVDALDECASQFLHELLESLHKLSKDGIAPGLRIKLLFTSREYTHILDSLDSSGFTARLFIDPELVSSDIRVAMQEDIKSIQRRLKLEDDEVGTLQESILKKSDGMFLWVSLAAKDIMDNAYDATFETLEELVEDLPSGLKGLYEKNWVKLVESLPNAKIALAKKVLTWVLLANRPLTISELTIALAVEPGQKEIPPPKKLLRNVSAFILNYLAPFVEIISSNTEVDTPKQADEDVKKSPMEPLLTAAPSYKPKDSTLVRLVHQSAQEYLLEACNTPSSRLEINLREGHESIARTCLTYLECKELQLGWIDPQLNDEGMYITTDATRSKVEARLNQFPFLGYASVNWALHVRKCQYLPKSVEEREEDDVFQEAINFVQDFPDGHACAGQARQLVNYWEGETHYAPPPPLHGFAGKDMLTIVKRLLRTPESHVASLDREQCTALHYPAQAEYSKEHPEEREAVVRALLEAGVDPNTPNILGDTPLSDAAAFPLPSVVKILLDRGVMVNMKNKLGRTPLNENNALGSREIVEGLLDHGADIDSVDGQGFRPILKAAGSEHWDTVKLLVARKCNIDAQCNWGWAALHYAAEKGELEIVRFLLDNGASIDIRSKDGVPPIHSAVHHNQKEVFELLRERGADMHIKDNASRSLLHVAAERASLELFQVILDLDTDVNAKFTNDWTPLALAAKRDHLEIVKLLVEKGADLKSTEVAGFTPLHLAVDTSSLNVARYLIGLTDDVNIPTSTGLTCLSLACGMHRPSTLPELIELLIDKGADVNLSLEDSGMTPLHVASCDGVLEAVKILLKHGADIEKPARLGLRPLCFACKEGKLEVAKHLYANGALLDCGKSTGSKDFSPMELTVFNGHIEVVQWLIDQGADVSHVTLSPVIREDRMMPHHDDIFKLMMQHGGDVNRTENGTDTPLLTALLLGNVEFAKLILKHKPNVRGRDSQGNSVYHAAIYQEDSELWEMLNAATSPEEWAYWQDDNGFTPCQNAIFHGQIDNLKLLSKFCPKESFVLKKPKDLWILLNGMNDVREKLELLYEMGALQVNFKDCTSLTDLDFTDYWRWTNLNCLETLDILDRLNFDWTITDASGSSVLHRAALESKSDIPGRLLQLKATNDFRGSHSMTIVDILMHQMTARMLPPSRIPRIPAYNYPLIWPPRKFVPFSQREPIPPLPPPPPPNFRIPPNGNFLHPHPPPPPPPPLEDFVPPPKKSLIPHLVSEDLSVTGTLQLADKAIAPIIIDTMPPISRSISQSSSSSSSQDLLPYIEYHGHDPNQTRAGFAVKNLFKSEAGDILVDDQGATLLHKAAHYGVSEIIRDVSMNDEGLEALAIKDNNGWTVAMIAHRWHHENFRPLLLKAAETNETGPQPTTKRPEKLSSILKGRDLYLSDKDVIVTMAGDVNCGIMQQVSPEGFKIQLTDKANSVTADAPIPYQDSTYYFEVELLKDPDSSGGSAIGLSTLVQDYNFHLPGWTRAMHCHDPNTSWGYHAVNGFRCPGDVAYSEPYGSPWRVGDIVGCGYDVDTGNIWFTKNGKFQGVAYRGVRGVLYPTLGLAGAGSQLKVIFDATPPPLNERVGNSDPAQVSIEISTV